VVRRPYWIVLAAMALLVPSVAVSGGITDIGSKLKSSFNKFADNPLEYTYNKTIGKATEFFTQPTIDNFGAEARNSVDYADRTLNETLARRTAIADTMIKLQQAELSDRISEATDDLNVLMTEKIRDLDDVLARQLGGLNIIGRVTTLRLTRALLGLILSAAVIAIVVLAVWALLAQRFAKVRRPPWDILGGGVTVIGVGAVAVVCYGYIEARTLEQDELRFFRTKLSALDLSSALRHASNLTLLEPENSYYEYLVERTSLARDVLLHAPSERGSDREALLLNRVFGLAGAFEKACGVEKSDPWLQALAASLVWHSGSTRLDEYQSAVHAATALVGGSFSFDKPARTKTRPTAIFESQFDCNESFTNPTFGLSPLAMHYLAAYLANPLTPEELALVDRRPGTETFVAETTLRRIRESARQSLPELQRASIEDSPLSSMVRFGEVARELNRTVIPAYVVMVYSDAMLSSEGQQDGSFWRQSRDDAANTIIAAYDGDSVSKGFVSTLAEAQPAGSSSRIRALRSSHAMYMRAATLIGATASMNSSAPTACMRRALLVALRRLPLRVGQPLPECSTAMSSLDRPSKAPERIPVHQRILEQQLRPSLRKFSYLALKQEADTNFARDMRSLSSFEDSMKKFIAARYAYVMSDSQKAVPEVMQPLLNSLVLNAQGVVDKGEGLGLFLCGEENQLCPTGNADVIPLPLIIYDLVPKFPGFPREKAPGLKEQIAVRNPVLM
jgi:hypothetical protein